MLLGLVAGASTMSQTQEGTSQPSWLRGDDDVSGTSSFSSSGRREARQEEIQQFASYIGMQPEEDAHLLWIAEAAVLSPVPKGWQQYETEDGYGKIFRSICANDRDHISANHCISLMLRPNGLLLYSD